MKNPKPINAARLAKRCDPNKLGFKDTSELRSRRGGFYQKRVVESLGLGLRLEGEKYNVFLSGPAGSGRKTIARKTAEEWANHQPPPQDIVLLTDYEQIDSPKSIFLPPGMGSQLRQDFAEWIEILLAIMKEVLASEESASRKRAVSAHFEEEKSRLLEFIRQTAEAAGFAIQQTDGGLATSPLIDGQPLSDDAFSRLPTQRVKEIHARQRELNEQVRKKYFSVRQIEQELRKALLSMEQTIAEEVIQQSSEYLLENFRHHPKVLDHIEETRKDITAHVRMFLEPPNEDLETRRERLLFLRRYRVNVLVNTAKTGGAPVVFEPDPSFANLIGRIDREMVQGAWLTDITGIKAGAIARANGGVLIVNASDLFNNHRAWRALKSALQFRTLRIEELPESLIGTGAGRFRPQPIPLNIRIIVLGTHQQYELLSNYDEEFKSLFRIQADMETHLVRNRASERSIASFIASQQRRNEALPLAARSVAAMIDHASRLAGHQDKLSLRLGLMTDLIVEADDLARIKGHKVISERDIQDALKSRKERAGRIPAMVYERIEDGVLQMEFAASTVGVVHGLGVFQVPGHAFGRPLRITCRTGMGNSGIINIERQVRGSDRSYDKGVLLLGGYLTHLFGQDKPLYLTASLAVEQLYQGIGGDSASAAELYALLSSLAEAPVKGWVTVTGSINQLGEMQAIGGVNEKIEGFFETLRRFKKKPKGAGVIIPFANRKNLQLSDEIIRAVEKGQFNIWTVKRLEEGVPILMDLPAGTRGADGKFTPDSLYRKADDRLMKMATTLRAFARPLKTAQKG